jgi:hypothetical protein
MVQHFKIVTLHSKLRALRVLFDKKRIMTVFHTGVIQVGAASENEAAELFRREVAKLQLVPQVDPVCTQIVASADFRTMIDLRKLQKQLKSSTFNPRTIRALCAEINCVHINVFGSGKIVMRSKTDDRFEDSLRFIYECVQTTK